MILITGGSGFIGRHIVKRACDNDREVVIITRDKNYEQVSNEVVIYGNLDYPLDIYEKCKGLGIDKCIHAAWEGIPDYSYINSKKSLEYGLNLMELANLLGINHIVCTGSCWEYLNPIGSVKSDSPLDYGNYFKAAKQSLRMMLHAFCKDHDIKLNWLRLFYVYGPGQRQQSLIPYIISTLQNHKELSLKSAYSRNDFIYIDDVVDAIYHSIDNDNYPEVINVGSGYSTRVLDIAKFIADYFGDIIEDSSFSQDGNEVDYYADAEEMQLTFGWKAKIDMKCGIYKMINEVINK